MEQYVKGFQRFHAGEDVRPVTSCKFLLYYYYYLNKLNLLLIRKLTTKSSLFTIKFCLKKTIQYKYYLQFISIKKTHIVPIKKFISIKNRYSNTNTNTNTNQYQY